MNLTRKQFENLKGGEWIFTADGTFEITSAYDSHHDTVETSEVIFDNDNGDSYHLEYSNRYTSFSDLRKGELI